MTNRAKIILEIKNACNSLFTRVSEKRVSEADINDTQLPALIISNLETTFSNQLDKAVFENYDIRLMILLADDIDNPLSALTEKEGEIIKSLFIWQPLLDLLNKDGIILKTSSASNSVKEHTKGSAIWSILSFSCTSVQCYD